MDLWGQIYLDHWRGDPHPHEFIRDDGKSTTVPDASACFAAPRSEVERAALATLEGRVLDLGCGAGSYTRFLEERGFDVTAIDASAGAVTVCQKRGCRDARLADMDSLAGVAGEFDAMICMGNTLGIGQSPRTLPQRLTSMRSLTVAGGKLLAHIRDPLTTTDPDHLTYHARNRERGVPAGLVRLRLSYRGQTGPWWELWMPTESELLPAAREAGWSARCLSHEGANRLYELVCSG